MTTTSAGASADQQLKAKHRAMWASGDYPAVAAELIPDLGPELVEASGIRAGHRVLTSAKDLKCSGCAYVTTAAEGPASPAAPVA